MSRARTDRIPVPVKCGADGCPRTLHWRGRVSRIEAVLNSWRVDIGWWDTPVQRDYYKTTLDNGGTLLLVHDHIAGAWFVRRIYD
ncbi:MAG: hypothetical protein JNL34_15565 [Anaerolineae bacterium]|nr:hypothetical protein [Anaerolineae bacterium]